jgi:hypothetical protein
MRPTYVANYLRISTPKVRGVFDRLDVPVERLHLRRDNAAMSRSAPC